MACAFDLSPKHSIAEVCHDNVAIDRTMLEMALDELPCKVSILARPDNLEESEEVKPNAVEQLFRCMSQMFPFVVIDLPRHFSEITLAALRSADRVFIVSQVAVPFLRNATRIYNGLMRAGVDEQRVDLVLNRCHGSKESISPQDVEKHFGRPVFASIPNDYKRITTSRDLGYPILTTAPNSPARLAIQSIARTLASSHLGEESLEGGKCGILSLFRRKRAKAGQPTT